MVNGSFLIVLKCLELMDRGEPGKNVLEVCLKRLSLFSERLPKHTIEKQALKGIIPGRKIEEEWRFLKSTVDNWLQRTDNRMILLSQSGALGDDDSLSQF